MLELAPQWLLKGAARLSSSNNQAQRFSPRRFVRVGGADSGGARQAQLGHQRMVRVCFELRAPLMCRVRQEGEWRSGATVHSQHVGCARIARDPARGLLALLWLQ